MDLPSSCPARGLRRRRTRPPAPPMRPRARTTARPLELRKMSTRRPPAGDSPRRAWRAPGTPASNWKTCDLREGEALLHEYARTRDPHLRDRLVELHTALVRTLARRFNPCGGNSSEDLVQVGFVGLIQAIDRFDPRSGCRFITYAIPTILGVIKHY